MTNYQDDENLESSLPENTEENAPLAPAPAPPVMPPVQSQAPINPIVAAMLQNKKEMADAQEKANVNQLLAGLGRAGSTLAQSAKGNRKPINTSAFDALDTAAQAPVQQVLSKQKAEEASLMNAKNLQSIDPNSPESQSFKATLKANFPQIAAAYGDKFDQLAAQDQNTILKVAETKSAIDQRAEAARERTDYLKTNAENKNNAIDSKEANKELAKMTEDLDPSKGRAGNFGKSGAMFNSSQRVQALISQFPDPNSMPPAQMHELAIAAANLVGGGAGSPGVEQIKALVPSSAVGDANGIFNWLSNNPGGANQGQFVKLLADTAKREGELAQKQIRDVQIQRLAGSYLHARKANPDAYNAKLRAIGIDPNNLDETGSFQPKNQASQGQNNSDSNLVARKTKDGRVGLFDPTTKNFVRYQ